MHTYIHAYTYIRVCSTTHILPCNILRCFCANIRILPRILKCKYAHVYVSTWVLRVRVYVCPNSLLNIHTCMYVCMFVCMYVCSSEYTYLYVYMCMCVCMYVIYVYVSTWVLRVRMYVCPNSVLNIHACIYVCMFVCMYVCSSEYTYLYIYMYICVYVCM
jgi:hypothetical protein